MCGSEPKCLYLSERGHRRRLPGCVQADFASACLCVERRQWARSQAGANVYLCAQLCGNVCVCVCVCL